MGVEPDDEAAADDEAAEAADEEAATATDLEPVEDRLETDELVFVDDLNDGIADLLERAPELRFDYVIGDVSSGGLSSNGHLHFDLVHEDATVHCVVFAYRLERLDPDVEDGLQVAVKGDLSYHEAGGNVSVLVEDVVELGEGIYERTYRKNRQLLAEDGLLDDEVKQSLPAFPRCVGIATSAESDAREDAVTSIHGRHPGVDVELRNTSVQGEQAMASMMRAISDLDDDAHVDVVVLTRGGGADKELRVFNETPLCRVIANTDTPIVVGVGHENDRTLADEVADRRVMTPTHVGEIVPERDALVEQVDGLEDRLAAAYERTVSRQLETLETGLAESYHQFAAGELDALGADLDRAFETVATERLATLDSRLDHALEQCEQRAAHERERADVERRYETSRRRQQVVIAALVLLLLVLLAYVLL